MVAKFENTQYTDYDKYLVYRKNQKKKERERLKSFIDSMKTECLFCKKRENLEFHHVNPIDKILDVTSLKTKKAIKEEVPKCWCLCEDCHNKLHQRLCDPLPTTYDIRISVP